MIRLDVGRLWAEVVGVDEEVEGLRICMWSS